MPECFVIMGFGEKKDPDSGRMLNLDATYESIIKPAVEDAGLVCIRADEIQHSGVIDAPMYEKLLSADLVIADISTANANAIYELGVRHALRPYSTILMKESEGRFHFDLNHLAAFGYEHLGKDVGAAEARTKVKALTALIKVKMETKADDSPVYEFLEGLQRPTIEALGGRRGGPASSPPASAGESLAELREQVREGLRQEDFVAARETLQKLLDRGFDDPWVIQKLAMSTYQGDLPDRGAALAEAWQIIQRLEPARSTDAETLGVAGAIRKRQWLMSKDLALLDDAIALYSRGWSVREDYYTGENYANCLEMRADATDDPEQSSLDRMTALRVRKQLIAYLEPLVQTSAAKKRDDYKWMLATLANTLFALGETAKGASYEKAFVEAKDANWELETFENTKKHMPAQAAKYAELRKKMGL